jgi:hypothetical protein
MILEAPLLIKEYQYLALTVVRGYGTGRENRVRVTTSLALHEWQGI